MFSDNQTKQLAKAAYEIMTRNLQVEEEEITPQTELSESASTEEVQELAQLLDTLVVEEAKRVTVRGNEFHALIEKYLYNNLNLCEEITDIDTNLLTLFNQLKPDLDKIDNIRGLETGLWSDTVGLAGRADCVAEYDGELSIIDFKGSTRTKRARDIENYYLQATAYALMWQDNFGEEIPFFKILISTEDGNAQVFSGRTVDYTKKLHEAIREYHEKHTTLFS